MRNSLIVFVAVLMTLAVFAPAAAGGQAASVAQEDPTCEFPFEGEDATGEGVVVEDEPDSVVALQPSDAQVMFEIGAEEKLEGIPDVPWVDYLEADDELGIPVDDDGVPIAEEVIDRDPDVVLAANALQDDDVIDQLRDAGLTVYVFPTEESLDGVAENVRLTGEIVGECDGAADSLEWMDERLELIEAATADEEQPLAYYAMGDGFTAGEGTFQHELLTTAGVENLGAEVGIEGWGEISEEDVIEEDPEWIIYGEGFEEPPVSEAVMETTAYQNEQFVAVNDNFMSQPGPLVVLAIEGIAEEVHPEAYAEAEAELEADDETETDDGDDADVDDTDDGVTDDADDADDAAAGGDSIPGFGVPAAVAALLGLTALLTRRR